MLVPAVAITHKTLSTLTTACCPLPRCPQPCHWSMPFVRNLCARSVCLSLWNRRPMSKTEARYGLSHNGGGGLCVLFDPTITHFSAWPILFRLYVFEGCGHLVLHIKASRSRSSFLPATALPRVSSSPLRVFCPSRIIMLAPLKVLVPRPRRAFTAPVSLFRAAMCWF
jgi:hypothetical protein